MRRSTALPAVAETCERLARASKGTLAGYIEELQRTGSEEIVTVTWDVTYDPLSHSICVLYEVATAKPNCYLLQSWAQDVVDAVGIPEYLPWAASIVEFEPELTVTKCKAALVDSKWRRDDEGAKYLALVWGYVQDGDEVVQYGPFVKEFVYPG